MSWLVLSPDAIHLPLTREVFENAVHQKWHDHAEILISNPADGVEARIHQPGDHPYRVILQSDAGAASTDGTWPQAADFAAWIRSLLPADFPGRLWLIDLGYSGHAELHYGITAEEVRNGWIDHATHGEPTDVK